MKKYLIFWWATVVLCIGGISLAANPSIVTKFIFNPDDNSLTAMTGQGTLKLSEHPGFVPVGAIVTFTPHIPGTFQPPPGAGSGVKGDPAVVVKQGFMILDGQLVPAGQKIPEGTALPDMNDDIFPMGAASSDGVKNGSNLKTPLGANSGTQALTAHEHGIAHAHQWGESGALPSVSSYPSLDDSSDETTATSTILYSPSEFADTGSGVERLTVWSSSDWYTTGVLSPPEGSNGSDADSESVSGGTVNFTNATFTGTQADYKPYNMKVVYAMRVK